LPASKIHAVDLNTDGTVTISGQFTDMANRTVKLLHIWLAQPGSDGTDGVGLATDALPAVNSRDLSFTLTSRGADNGSFRHGPAIVSAIAVISPDNASDGPPSEVIQWSRSLTLSPHEANHVALSTF
jgi:hypothetical protein